ncbi:hypothetical protein EON63_25415 [archaeon]|nr:MAG: hypothetical protein EON63_25415 [archaeon]
MDCYNSAEASQKAKEMMVRWGILTPLQVVTTCIHYITYCINMLKHTLIHILIHKYLLVHARA